MPEGAVHLTNRRRPPCGREGRYLVGRLVAQHGDMGLPDVLALMMQDCPERQNAAVYGGPSHVPLVAITSLKSAN